MHTPKHADRPADPAILARCKCVRLEHCPRHHPDAYSKLAAKHRGESAEVAA